MSAIAEANFTFAPLDVAALRMRFAPDPARLPNVVVQLAPLNAYEELLGESLTGDAA